MKTRAYFAIALGAVAAMVVIDRLDLLHQSSPGIVSNKVYLARYLLDRWPRDWSEVHTVLASLPEPAPSGMKLYRSVEIVPVDPDRCVVTAHGTNLIGWPYADRMTLEWNPRRKMWAMKSLEWYLHPNRKIETQPKH